MQRTPRYKVREYYILLPAVTYKCVGSGCPTTVSSNPGLGGRLLVGRPILAGGSLMRSGLTRVGEPKIGEHAQRHYVASVRS
jgi:hypothetical protein